MQQAGIAKIKQWLGTGSINIFGMPLSGKDTQGRTLAELLDAPLISGGEIIRSSNNEEAKAIISRGNLAPTDVYVAMITPHFSKTEFAGKPLILSSVGRWHGEEDAIVQATNSSNHPLKAVIFLDLPEPEVHQRLKLAAESHDRNDRSDDAEKFLATRFEEFKTKTLPVIDYYREKGLLVEINGNQPRNNVAEDILAALLELATQ